MGIFKVYFDYESIKLDRDGDIINEEDCVYIAEYEWDEDTETVGAFIRRIEARYGHFNEFPMDITVEEMEDMESMRDEYGTPAEALDALNDYLEGHKEWKTIYMGYYEPDLYECEGLEDREDSYYRVLAIKAVHERKAQEA